MNQSEMEHLFSKARARRTPWEAMWEDCIDYCMPARQSFWDSNVGQERTERVFDETPILATAEFASRMQAAILPPGRRWFRLVVGEKVDSATRKRVQGELDEVTDYLWSQIQRSNLDAEVHEAFMDLAIGTTAMVVTMNDEKELVFKTAPLPTVFLSEGPDGRVGGIFRERHNVTAETIYARYGVSVEDSREYRLFEATVRDYKDRANESWHYSIWMEGGEELKTEHYSGWGTCPWVAARWSETAEEWYGRGPLINVLPAIRSVNLIRELVFENAEMAIGGIWQYPNDGTINPSQIQIAPNTFIPKAPGSSGLEPLNSPARFDVAEAGLLDLRQNIKRALFSEEFTPTGRTPLSAQEIAARQTDLANRVGSPFARVMKELIEPIVKRVARLYIDAGHIKLPKIDGKDIKVVSVSPLARAQGAEDIMRMQSFIQSLVSIMGPEATGTFIRTEETVALLAQLYEYPMKLLHDNASRMQEMQKNQELGKMMEGAMQVSPNQPSHQIIEKQNTVGQPTGYPG